jgi:hypothetical protein
MKKLMFLGAIAISAMFASCSKEDITTDTVGSTVGSDLTSSLVTNSDLLTTYNDLSASARGGGGNETGDFKGGKGCKEISVDSLSDIIKTYIAANYIGATTNKAFKGKGAEIVVLITKADGTKVGLVFDAAGAFQKEVTKGKDDPKKDLTAINIATLSATITTYISTTYVGSKVEKAYTDSNGNFFVVVVKADGTKVAVLFDAKGVFVKELPKHGKGALTVIDVATLPATITTYVSTNYAGYTVHKAYTDGSGNYLLSLKNTKGVEVRLLFDVNGVFVKVLKKK